MEIAFGSVLHDYVDVVLIVEGLAQFDDMGVTYFAEDGHL